MKVQDTKLFVKLRIENLCAEDPPRGRFRYEPIDSILFEEEQQEFVERNTGESIQRGEARIRKRTRNVAVATFKEGPSLSWLPARIIGALKEVRALGGPKSPLYRLKAQFNYTLFVRDFKVEEVGSILPSVHNRFVRAKGGRFGMIVRYSDVLDFVEVSFHLESAFISAEDMKFAVMGLEKVRFGPARTATIKVLEVKEV